MLGGGTPLPTIASVLGHAGTEATAAYLGVDAASLAGCALPVPEVSSPTTAGAPCSRPAFASGFAAELDAYIDMKVACGFKERSFAGVLAKFDRFCAARGIDGVAFTRDDADEWERRLPGEATTTFYARVNKSKGFLDHLVAKGVPGVRPVRDVPFRPTAFRPHIYTDGEVASYFREVDAWSTPRSRPDEVQFPVLFRTLYCCGTRVGETLGIRKRDVDLGAGTVVLNETKNDRQRLVALGPQMAAMYSRLADKEFYLLGGDDYV